MRNPCLTAGVFAFREVVHHQSAGCPSALAARNQSVNRCSAPICKITTDLRRAESRRKPPRIVPSTRQVIIHRIITESGVRPPGWRFGCAGCVASKSLGSCHHKPRCSTVGPPPRGLAMRGSCPSSSFRRNHHRLAFKQPAVRADLLPHVEPTQSHLASSHPRAMANQGLLCTESRRSRRASPDRPRGLANWLRKARRLQVVRIGQHKAHRSTVGSPSRGLAMHGEPIWRLQFVMKAIIGVPLVRWLALHVSRPAP